ncbi:MAG: hypothetical protein MUO72_09240 [Bacteroidales bacterium]|nr:hypothetical protein [Bacteroidales bacterium]
MFYYSRLKKVCAFIALLLLSYSLLAQDIQNSNLFAGVEIGSKIYYTIRVQNGMEYKARIVSVDPDKVLLLLPGDKSLTISTREIIEINRQSHYSSGSLGVGFGIPYGVLGANLDIKLAGVLNVTAGLGSGIWVNPMYSAGLKCFLRSGNYKFRPRIEALYGTASMINVQDSNGETVEKGSFNSFVLGAGFQWALDISRTWGFDFDIIYIVDDSELESRLDYLINQGYNLDVVATGNVKVSLGLRYIF